jgi:phage-related protein
MANEVTILVNSKDKTKEGFDSATRNASGFKDALKGISVAFAGLAVIDFFKGTMDEARESIRTNNLTAAAIKSTGGVAKVTADQVGALATKLSNLTGVDDELIQSGENLLLTFTNIRNQAGKNNDIFNQATVVAEDMTAALNDGAVTQEGLKASSIQLGKALNDPIKGITALQRVGVTFSAEQKKQIENFMKHNDIMSAQKVILAELNKEFGGAAAAAADPAQKAQVAWKNFQEEIGLRLMPEVNKLLNLFVQILPPVMAIVDAIVNFAMGNKLLVGFLLAVVAALKIWTIVQAILDAELWSNPIGLIILAIVALVAAIIWVATKTTWFQSIWKAVWDFLKGVGHWFAHDFVDFFVGAWNKIFGFFKGIGTAISDTFHGAINTVKGAINRIIDLVNKAISFINNNLIGTLNKIPGVNLPSLVLLPHLASGGFGSGLAVVGERGRELVDLGAGARVYNNNQTEQMLAGNGSGANITLTIDMRNAPAEMKAWLRKVVTVEGGGSVQLAFGN